MLNLDDMASWRWSLVLRCRAEAVRQAEVLLGRRGHFFVLELLGTDMQGSVMQHTLLWACDKLLPEDRPLPA